MTRGVRPVSGQRGLYHLAAAGKIPSDGRKMVSTNSKTRMWIVDYFSLLGSWISSFSKRDCGIGIDGFGSYAFWVYAIEAHRTHRSWVVL
jgi:hypothetical protein